MPVGTADGLALRVRLRSVDDRARSSARPCDGRCNAIANRRHGRGGRALRRSCGSRMQRLQLLGQVAGFSGSNKHAAAGVVDHFRIRAVRGLHDRHAVGQGFENRQPFAFAIHGRHAHHVERLQDLESSRRDRARRRYSNSSAKPHDCKSVSNRGQIRLDRPRRDSRPRRAAAAAGRGARAECETPRPKDAAPSREQMRAK